MTGVCVQPLCLHEPHCKGMHICRQVWLHELKPTTWMALKQQLSFEVCAMQVLQAAAPLRKLLLMLTGALSTQRAAGT